MSQQRKLVLTWLTRNSVHSTADLNEFTLDDIRDWRSIGEERLAQIVEALNELDENASAVLAEVTLGSAGSGSSTIGVRYPHLRWIGKLALGGPELARFFRIRERRLILTWFARNSVHSTADLIDLTLDDIADWRGIGKDKLGQIVEALNEIDENACAVLAGLAFPDLDDDSVDQPVLDTQVAENLLRTLTAWGAFANGAGTLGALDAVLRSEPMPAEVEQAAKALAAMPFQTATQRDPVVILRGWVESLGERDADILRSRVVKFEPANLDEIGERHGVSRERIRQLETHLTARIRARVSQPGWTSVRWAVHRLRRGLGAYAPDNELPLLDAQGERSYEFGIVLWLAGFIWQQDNRLLVRDGFTLPVPASIPVINAGPVVDEPRLRLQLAEMGVVEQHFDLAVNALPGLNRVDGQLVLWPRGIVAQAMSVLSVRGFPMTPDELAEIIGGGFNLRGFRNRLFNDPQICRVTKSTVGLREWGDDEYTNIADMMCQRLEASGSLLVDELAADLSEEFGVSKNSIMMYSAAPIFVVEDGVLRLRRADEPYVPRHEPEKVRGLYFSEEDVALWHILVDNDVIRGSGRALPGEIATHMGVASGTRVLLVAADGPVPVNWPETSNVGPVIGSLRNLAEASTAQLGDTLSMKFDRRDHSLNASVRHPRLPDEPIDEISALTGLRASACSSRAELAFAIQCSPDLVVDLLRKRGDDEVADLAAALPATQE